MVFILKHASAINQLWYSVDYTGTLQNEDQMFSRLLQELTKYCITLYDNNPTEQSAIGEQQWETG